MAIHKYKIRFLFILGAPGVEKTNPVIPHTAPEPFFNKKILPLWDPYGMKVYVSTVILPYSTKYETWPFLRKCNFKIFTQISPKMTLKQ